MQPILSTGMSAAPSPECACQVTKTPPALCVPCGVSRPQRAHSGGVLYGACPGRHNEIFANEFSVSAYVGEDAFQLVQAVIANDELAAAAGRLVHFDPGAELLGEVALEALH